MLSCVRIPAVGHHLLDSLEICQTNSIYVYIGTYGLELNVCREIRGERKDFFLESWVCWHSLCYSLFSWLAEIDHQLVGKREDFLKYISWSLGQLPFPHLCLNMKTPSYLAKHSLSKAISGQTIPCYMSRFRAVSEPEGGFSVFFWFHICGFSIYLQVLSHTFHPQNNSSECGYYYSSVDRWWKIQVSSHLWSTVPCAIYGEKCFPHVFSWLFCSHHSNPIWQMKKPRYKAVQGTCSYPVSGESEVPTRPVWRSSLCFNDYALPS